MTNFAILTDSTTDLPSNLFDQINLFHEPHSFIIDGVSYKDSFWNEMSKESFFEILRSGHLITTSQADIDKIYFDVESIFAQGRDVIYISFSKELSGTFNTVSMISQEFMEKYPERRLAVVDSFCGTMGQGMLVESALKMALNGSTFEEVIDYVTAERDKIYHYFTVDDLMHLKRGGRLSSSSAIVGTLIGIKPILHMSDDGKLVPIGKIRGRHNSLDEIIKLSMNKFDDSTTEIQIVHSDCPKDADYIAEKLKKAGFINLKIACIGPVISSHVGAGAIGILFHSEK